MGTQNRNKKLHGRYDGLKYGWLMDAKKFILLLIVVFFSLRLVIGFSFVNGDSMEPTLHSGELVMYFRLNQDYQKGDVVSVRIPSGEYYVKRIIALEGDLIDIKDGTVYVNGAPLEETYIQGETHPQPGAVRYPFRLQKGQIFVMGDNREISMDSRSFGVVGRGQIKGKLLFHGGWGYVKGL
ncbi:MAG: signal peptidase I [Lachnospiraceae bacterium]|nr:signal peptidase I [Lachnospiraceae bacterium]